MPLFADVFRRRLCCPLLSKTHYFVGRNVGIGNFLLLPLFNSTDEQLIGFVLLALSSSFISSIDRSRSTCQLTANLVLLRIRHAIFTVELPRAILSTKAAAD